MNLRSRALSALGTRAENPAWDYIKAVPNDTLMGFRGGFSPSNSSISQEIDDAMQNPGGLPLGKRRFIGYRSRVTARWTWAIPAPQTLQWIANQVESVVELGAGNGYWAWQLAQLGIDVNAYDIAPPGHEHSWFHPHEEMAREDDWYDFEVKEFHPVHQGSVEVLERPENEGRTLLLVWPNYDSPFAYDAVKAFKGDEFIYIGEFYGCNADASFGCLIGERWFYGSLDRAPDPMPDKEWERVDEGPMIQWGGIHDRVVKFRRLSEPIPMDQVKEDDW